MKNKCYGCEERVVGCHSFCDHYKEYVRKNEAKKKKEREEKDRYYLNSSWSYTKGRKRK